MSVTAAPWITRPRDRLAVLDSIPILEALERADARFAEMWPHWFFFSTADAERVISADPLAWYRPDRDQMGVENYDDMTAAIINPATVRAMLEDCRASLHIDRANDEHDRSTGRNIINPTLVAWSTRDDMELLYGNPSAIWASWCSAPFWNPARWILDTTWLKRTRDNSPPF